MKLHPKIAKKELLNLLVFAIAVITIVFVVLGYLRLVQMEEQERVNQVVQESATQSVALIHERIYNSMARIEEIAFYLGQHDIPINSKKTLNAMQAFDSQVQAFEAITTATADGTLYGISGEVLGNIAEHTHFKCAMEGQICISDVEQSVDSNKSIVCVTAPINRKGEIIGIVNGQLVMSSMEKLLSVKSFGGLGYSYVTNSNGNIIAYTNRPEGERSYSNLLKSLHSSSLSDEELEDMYQDMQSGKTGRISYSWNGEKRTLSYMPVEINDWYYLSVIPNDIVMSRATALTKQAFALSGALLAILVFLAFYVNSSRRKSQSALAAVHRELLTIYNAIPGGVFKCHADEHFTLVEANDGFYRFLGYSKQELEEQFQNRLACFMNPDDLERVRLSVARQFETLESTRDEVRVNIADGKEKWLLVCGDVLSSPGGKALIYCCFTDITELKETQDQLREAKQRYDIIIEDTQEIIFEWNPLTRSVLHSKIFEKKFGYPCNFENFPQSIIEKHLVAPEDEEQCLATYQRIEDGEHFSTGEFRIKKSNGDFLWCRVSITAIVDADNRLCRAVGVITDIDRDKRELYEATEQAQRDAMTGLYNKTTTEQLIDRRLKSPIKLAALLTVDLDNFKDVNDTLGHASGDMALIEVANQLTRLFRATDIVGRVGGDEFLVFVEGLGQGEILLQKLNEISRVFNWSFRKNDLVYSLSCSIGVALFPENGASCGELYKRADAALYYAKRNGKNQFAIYNEEMQETIHGVEDVEAAPPWGWGGEVPAE
ncbi:MAG: diguanylate cyclase [Oscillospiraceae bacterium]